MTKTADREAGTKPETSGPDGPSGDAARDRARRQVDRLWRRGCEFLFESAKLLFELLQLLDLLARRLALQLLPRTQVVDLRHELAPALVGFEQLVERLHGSLAREGFADSLGIGPRGPKVDQPFVR